jgi:hypothetical protein
MGSRERSAPRDRADHRGSSTGQPGAQGQARAEPRAAG